MLPRPDAPATRLPYTTADMGERLAKRKAEQDAEFKANALNTLANYKPKEDKPWYEDVAGAIGGAIKYVYDNAPSSNPISTPINMGGNAGVSMGGQGTGKSLVTEPARLAVRRAVGDITAIPRVGKPSPSYTADQIREQGVARGVLGAAIDYSNFIPVVAKGAGFASDAVNAYKLAMMERQANPFPALRGASNVIDVVPGSRLPTRVVDAPTPATRLGNAMAQMTLDARVAQGGVRDAGILRMPGSYPAGERYVFDYNQSDPAYVIDKQSTNAISRSYDKVGPGEKLIDTKGTETGVPGRSYTSNKMVALQSPQGNATLGYDIETRVINGTPQPRIVLQPISAAKGSIGQVKQLLDFLYGRYKNAVIDWGNISTELPNELFYEYNNRFPVRTVGESVGNPLENFNAPKTNINVLLDTPQRGAIPYTELYDAIGVLENNRIYPTSEFKQLIQKFGLQGREREVLDAFARREGIVEPSRLSSWQKFVNEMQRQIDMGDYFDENPLPQPATRLAQAQAQRPQATTADMAEQLARAQARQTTQFNEPLLIDENFALSIKEGTFNPSSYRGIYPNATYSFGEINISRPGAKEDGFIRFEIHKFDNKTIDRIELDIVDSNLNYAEKRAAIKEIYDRYPKAEILWADMLEGAPEVSLAKEFEALYGRTNFDLVPDEEMRFDED